MSDGPWISLSDPKRIKSEVEWQAEIDHWRGEASRLMQREQHKVMELREALREAEHDRKEAERDRRAADAELHEVTARLREGL